MNNEQEVNVGCIPENLTLEDILRARLRANPDRLIIGEFRGSLPVGFEGPISAGVHITIQTVPCSVPEVPDSESFRATALANTNARIIFEPAPYTARISYGTKEISGGACRTEIQGIPEGAKVVEGDTVENSGYLYRDVDIPVDVSASEPFTLREVVVETWGKPHPIGEVLDEVKAIAN